MHWVYSVARRAFKHICIALASACVSNFMMCIFSGEAHSAQRGDTKTKRQHKLKGDVNDMMPPWAEWLIQGHRPGTTIVVAVFLNSYAQGELFGKIPCKHLLLLLIILLRLPLPLLLLLHIYKIYWICWSTVSPWPFKCINSTIVLLAQCDAKAIQHPKSRSECTHTKGSKLHKIGLVAWPANSSEQVPRHLDHFAIN